MYFSFNHVKNKFPHFVRPTKFKQNFALECSLWRLFFVVKGRYCLTVYASFKKYLFLMSLRLYKNENFAACAPRAQSKLLIFSNLYTRSYTWSAAPICPFSKTAKSAVSLHPNLLYSCCWRSLFSAFLYMHDA